MILIQKVSIIIKYKNNQYINVGSDIAMFFAKPGTYKPSGLFSIGHIILFILTLIIVCIVLRYTKNKQKEEVTNIIKKTTIFLWILEIIKIVFNFLVGNGKNPNNYIPLYYCSLILYAGIFSGYCRGILKKIGDVFIATGAIIGGLCFLIIPNTSLTMYPAFHYISFQSFVFHGSMLYLGILVNITNYVQINAKDIIYYALYIVVVALIALIINKLLNTNLMFISKNYPGTPVSWVYNTFKKAFSAVMIIGQAVIPFYMVYFVKKIRCGGKKVILQLKSGE